jgi:hypothetical protein
MSQDNVSTLVYSTLGRFQEAAAHAGDKQGHVAMQNALQEVHADQRSAGKFAGTYDANVAAAVQSNLKGVLPELSISYVEANAAKIDPTHGGKDISRQELQDYKSSGISPVEKVFVQQVIDNYDKLTQTRPGETTPVGHMSANELSGLLQQKSPLPQPDSGSDGQGTATQHESGDRSALAAGQTPHSDAAKTQRSDIPPGTSVNLLAAMAAKRLDDGGDDQSKAQYLKDAIAYSKGKFSGGEDIFLSQFNKLAAGKLESKDDGSYTYTTETGHKISVPAQK